MSSEVRLPTSGGTSIRVGGDRAFYSPLTDHIGLPPDNAFSTPAAWSATALHEAIHWCGADHRLKRDLSGSFGSAKYADEELVAEMGSSFLGMTLNIPSDLPNHVSYIDHWLQKLRGDKRAIFKAAASAQRAVDYLSARQP